MTQPTHVFLTKRAECYSLQRLNDLINHQKFHLADLRQQHRQGDSYAETGPIHELLIINAEIKSLLTLNAMFAEINRDAAKWGAIAPTCEPHPEHCGAEDMMSFEEVPF